MFAWDWRNFILILREHMNMIFFANFWELRDLSFRTFSHSPPALSSRKRKCIWLWNSKFYNLDIVGQHKWVVLLEAIHKSICMYVFDYGIIRSSHMKIYTLYSSWAAILKGKVEKKKFCNFSGVIKRVSCSFTSVLIISALNQIVFQACI